MESNYSNSLREEEKKNQQNYDQIPYPSASFPQTHIVNLALIAQMYGLKSQPIEKCRVLELGCSDGGNLIPMAISFPESNFVGIDLSKNHIEKANDFVQSLNAKNIEFKNISILDIDLKQEPFDYIITHGVFSWVPKEVQEKIFEICNKLLSPNGIAYISYNIYPGWHLRESFRDMMCYHVRSSKTQEEKAQKAIEFINILSQNVLDEDYRYQIEWMRNLLGTGVTTSYFIHEYLEQNNHPCYFYKFMENAQKYHLQFLSEANPSSTYIKNLPPYTQNILQQTAQDDVIVQEQYLDFLFNRPFRQTILCHKNIEIKQNNFEDVPIENFYISAKLTTEAEEENIYNNTEISFENTNGYKFTIKHPIIKTSLYYLNQIFPLNIRNDQLFQKAYAKLTPSTVNIINSENLKKNQDVLKKSLFDLFLAGILQIDIMPSPFTIHVNDFPKAYPVAKLMAEKDYFVTNSLHQQIYLQNDFSRELLKLLDGTKSHDNLIDELVDLVNDGVLTVMKKGAPITEPIEIKNTVKETIKEELKNLAKNALLID